MLVRAQVALAGSLDEFFPVSIFNPYSTPFAGDNIAKGKLTTDLHSGARAQGRRE